MHRGVPAMRIGGALVTTVLDLALAQYGVGRDGLPGDWPSGYDDAEQPCTPAWQEQITGVDRRLAARVAREFARNAEVTEGRSMICMGAGTNHWFHSDQVYRTFLALVMMCGCEGRNGGGWAHYVGQEKVRPLTGWQTVAFALDWVRPPRHQSGTPFFYLATGQWRYERIQPEHLASPLGRGLLAGRHIARRERARRPAGVAAVVSELRPLARWSWSTRPSARGSPRPSTSCASCGRAGCGSRARTPTRRRTIRR